jgi:hypothetical protein
MTGIFIFPVVGLSLEILFYFLAGNSFLNVEVVEVRKCYQTSTSKIFCQNKYLISNIKIFHYVNSKYIMCPPIF